jgi:hypothetical protein
VLIQLIVNFLTRSGGWEPCYFPRMKEDTLIQQIAAKKAELDRLRPLAPRGLDNLNRSYDIELTYTSTQSKATRRLPPKRGW